MATKNIELKLISQNQFGINDLLNENFVKIDKISHLSIKNIISEIPNTLNDGEIFIVSDNINNNAELYEYRKKILVYSSNGGIEFLTPTIGMFAYLISENKYYYFDNEWKIFKINNNQIGDYKYSAKNNDHEGWLLCDGKFINKNTYIDLFNTLGTAVENNNTFQIPNLQNKFLNKVKKDHIINGDFSIWSNGTSFLPATTGQITADKWYTQYTDNIEKTSIGEFKIQGTSSSSRIGQIISSDLRGKTVTISFEAYLVSGTALCRIRYFNYSGGAQYVTNNTGQWLNDNFTISITKQKFVATFTIPNDGNGSSFYLEIYTNYGANPNNVTMFIDNVKLEEESATMLVDKFVNTFIYSGI